MHLRMSYLVPLALALGSLRQAWKSGFRANHWRTGLAAILAYLSWGSTMIVINEIDKRDNKKYPARTKSDKEFEKSFFPAMVITVVLVPIYIMVGTRRSLGSIISRRKNKRRDFLF